MRFLVSTFVLVCSVLFSGSALASAGGSVPFNDGDVLLWGVNDGVTCTGMCIKTERRGNTLITSVYNEDAALMKVSADPLTPSSASMRAPSEVILYTPDQSGNSPSATPVPPIGGNGSVMVNDVFPGDGGFWNRNTISTFSNYHLVDVKVTISFVHYMPK